VKDELKNSLDMQHGCSRLVWNRFHLFPERCFRDICLLISVDWAVPALQFILRGLRRETSFGVVVLSCGDPRFLASDYSLVRS
jgi:hypothetical protein